MSVKRLAAFMIMCLDHLTEERCVGVAKDQNDFICLGSVNAMFDHLTEEQKASLQSMIAIAMASTIRVEGLQLPWKEPVFKAIFLSGKAPVP